MVLIYKKGDPDDILHHISIGQVPKTYELGTTVLARLITDMQKRNKCRANHKKASCAIHAP